MDLRGPGLPQQADDARDGRAAHDAVVHEDDPLPRTVEAMVLSFMRTASSRRAWPGWMKVRPMYLLFTKPTP